MRGIHERQGRCLFQTGTQILIRTRKYILDAFVEARSRSELRLPGSREAVTTDIKVETTKPSYKD